ncbi:MAG: phosphatase PAP2 family protein [Acidimicrobiia bacterium]|nr:phosphatase PAP2 family protein [Acidimicrobiia bacterium]
MRWIPWDAALAGAVCLGGPGLAWRRVGARASVLAAMAREAALVLVLYALWQFGGRLSLMGTSGAFERGRQVWQIQRWLQLPDEAMLERWALGVPWFMRACNVYYLAAHVPVLIGFLIWMFVRHRGEYRRTRNVLAIGTAACFAIQLVPVAPPRMYPQLGFVDAAKVFGQSVYPDLGAAGPAQLSALPSVHVAWALLVGFVAWRVSRSRWRYLAVGHAVATVVVVVVTANHWWLDAIAAAGCMAAAWAALEALSRARRRPWPATTGLRPAPPGPEAALTSR